MNLLVIYRIVFEWTLQGHPVKFLYLWVKGLSDFTSVVIIENRTLTPFYEVDAVPWELSLLDGSKVLLRIHFLESRLQD